MKNEKFKTLPKTPVKFTFEIVKTYWKFGVAAIFAVIFARSVETFSSYVIKLLVDAINEVQGAEIKDFSQVWKYLALFIGVYFLMNVLWRTSGFCGMRWVTKSRALAYSRLFAYLSGHGARYFSNRFAGNLTNKVSNVGEGLDSLLIKSLWNFLPVVIQLIGAIFLTFLENYWLALLLFFWSFVFLLINFFLVQRSSYLSEIHAEASSNLHGQMVDIATNISVVHYYAKRFAELTHLKKFIDKRQKTGLRGWIYSEMILVINGILQLLLLAMMFSGAIYLWSHGEITVGAVIMIITISLQTTGSLFFIGMNMTEFMESYGQMKEGLDEIVVDYDVKDIPEAKKLTVKKGAIDFEKMSFRYGKGKYVFKDLNLHIPSGQKVGIVGESGVGKTTLAFLLLRFYDLIQGHISIDGKDIAQVQQESLRANIAFVPQEPLLFHRTIRENIAYGKTKSTQKAIEKVAKMANAQEFIKDLPDKYDTYVGERGVKLSGGQKQRVAIARAMLKNAPILVLDEATSALDSESEAAVQGALKNLMKGKTVLAIAHRLSTLLAMDRIIVLDKGKVLEDGTHAELLKKGGIYAKLWKRQAGGFIQ